MNRIEELKRALSDARRAWKWDDVRRLEAELAAEHERLKKVAQNLPPVPDFEAMRAAGIAGVVAAAATSERKTEPAPPPAPKKQTKKKKTTKKG